MSERLSQETDDKLNIDGAKSRDTIAASPVVREHKTVYLDLDDGSPVRIPNSQAPIPGRDVFWDLDTPETKRNRDALNKKLEAKADSPLVGSRMMSLTPKMKLVPRKRAELDPSRGIDSRGRGLADLEELMNFVETTGGDDSGDEEDSNCLHLSKSPRTESEAFPEDGKEKVSIDSGDMFEDEFCDEDDEILLLATQQPVEEGNTEPTPSTSYSASEEKGHPKALTPREKDVSATTKTTSDDIDDLFGDDDDFDDAMSQMEMPEFDPLPKLSKAQSSASSLTLAPPSTTSSIKSSIKISSKQTTPKVRNSNFAISGFENEFDDSFDNVLSQIEVPSIAPPNKNLTILGADKTSGPFTSTQKPSPLTAKAPVPVVQPKPKMTFQFPLRKNSECVKENISSSGNSLVGSRGGGPVRKFRSFNSPPREKKLIAKFKSDSSIPSKPPCSKEEIERKRKEALARKQMLQSQKQQRR